MHENINLMKEMNLNLLRQIMKLQRKATKPQLATLSGLSVVTVNSLIKVLLSRGEVIEDETVFFSGGRPPRAYRFNAEYKLALVIYMHEVGGDDVAFISVDNLWGEHMEKTEKILNQMSLSYLDLIIENYIDKYPNIQVIAFGMPGIELQGRLDIIDYESLQGKAFTKYFEEKFHLPVLLENDLNAAVMGYCDVHEIKEEECVAAVYYPWKYPPGAGIFMNGRIYKGRDGFAGEVKYLPIDVNWQGLNTPSFGRCDAVAKIILSVISLYNPHQIVLYGENLPENIFAELMCHCKKHLPHNVLPELIISTNFNHDFAKGIQRVALQFLEPKLMIKNGRD